MVGELWGGTKKVAGLQDKQPGYRIKVARLQDKKVARLQDKK